MMYYPIGHIGQPTGEIRLLLLFLLLLLIEVRLAGWISGIFNITLIDFDRFTVASIINNS